MKKLLIVIFILAFAAMSASAQVPAKPIKIFAGAGLGFPSSPSEFSDFWKMGFNGLAGASFNVAPKMDILGKLEYHNFAFDWGDLPGSGGALSFLMFGADLKFSLGVPAAPAKPFLLAGVGMANISIDVDGIDSESDLFFEFGGGVDFNKFFVMARYVSVATEGESTAYIPFSVGVTF